MLRVKKGLLTHLPLLLFCIFYISFGLATYNQFGVTTDEPVEYDSATALYNYLKKEVSPRPEVKSLAKLSEADLRQTPLFSKYYRGNLLVYSWVDGISYAEYHFLNILLALPIFIAAYAVGLLMFKKPLIAVLAPLALMLDPRLLGHIPANTKDAPFAVYYFVALCAMAFSKHIKNPVYRVLGLGLVFSLAQSIRTVGFSIYLVYVSYLIYLVLKKEVKAGFNMLGELVLIFIVANFFMMLTWPYIGSNYLANLHALGSYASGFSDWGGTMLFNGQVYSATQRPWNYLVTWFMITTPLISSFWLVFGFTRLKKLLKLDGYFIFLSAFVINWALYIAIQPIIYNAYRHYLYLFVISTFLAYISFAEFCTSNLSKKLKLSLTGVTLLYCIVLVTTLKTLHPYEYIYFNELVGGLHGAYGKYETDYWLTSRKEATTWVLTNLEYKNEVVYACNLAEIISYYSAKKLAVVNEPANATISICDEKRETDLHISGPIIYEVKRFGVPLTRIRRLATPKM